MEYQLQALDSRAIVADVPISTCRLQLLVGGLASGGKQTASLKDETHRHHHWQHNDGWQSSAGQGRIRQYQCQALRAIHGSALPQAFRQLRFCRPEIPIIQPLTCLQAAAPAIRAHQYRPAPPRLPATSIF